MGHAIKLIEPQLIKCIQTKNDNKLLVALLDLDIRNDDELNCLCPEFKDILKRKDTIRIDQKNDFVILDRIYGLLTDYYIDRFKLIGINVKTKIPKLLKFINNYDYTGLVSLYEQHGSSAAEDIQHNELS